MSYIVGMSFHRSTRCTEAILNAFLAAMAGTVAGVYVIAINASYSDYLTHLQQHPRLPWVPWTESVFGPTAIGTQFAYLALSILFIGIPAARAWVGDVLPLPAWFVRVEGEPLHRFLAGAALGALMAAQLCRLIEFHT